MGWKPFAVRKNSEAMGASGILDKKRFMKEGEQVKRRKWLLAAMGGLSLLLARPVQAKTGELTLSQAARVYDARGIPTQYSFKKGTKVAYAGKPARAKHARYSFYKNGLEYALPVVTINHLLPLGGRHLAAGQSGRPNRRPFGLRALDHRHRHDC